MEHFGHYKFRIFYDATEKGWRYHITCDGFDILRESKDVFPVEGLARFAAIGHISLLEKGEG